MEHKVSILRCNRIILVLGLCVLVIVSIIAYTRFDLFSPAARTIVKKIRPAIDIINQSFNRKYDNSSRLAENLVEKTTNTSVPVSRKFTIETHKVTGASKKQGKEFGYLKPNDHFVVPNIAHFVWFSCRTFKFENLISMLSAHRIMKADKVYFHTNCEPSGEWWIQAKTLIPTLTVVNRTSPTKVFNKTLSTKYIEHHADVARIQILLEMGGVYFDPDVFVLAPLEPLRYYEFVIGKEAIKFFNNGVLIASNSSKFLKVYYENYKNYKSSCWGCTSIRDINGLASKHVNFLHIEPHSMIQPNPLDWRLLFFEKYKWEEEHFTIHVWFRYYRTRAPKPMEFNPENIKQLNTTIGEMCRYIYYGSPAIIV
ncbi:uncharacterized protein [Ptychodera flava]|uniref:uncharacterized protein isoform X2 n=1 Tax=Ptychodera flava TaxID=63121 RepID=UPI00396A90D1